MKTDPNPLGVFKRPSNRIPATLVEAENDRANPYEIRNADGDVAEILLYDEIGFWGVTASRFVRDLEKVTAGVVNLRINSPGGDVFDGIAIYNALNRHKATINVTIDGLAASAASYIAMAGDTIAIAPEAFVMIHNAQALTWGDHREMTQLAALMQKIDGVIASMYAKRSGKTVDEYRDAMNAETWYSAQEAVDAGLADRVVDQVNPNNMVAKFDLSGFRNTPEPIVNRFGGRKVETIRDIEDVLRDAGVSASKAKAILAGEKQRAQREVADETLREATSRAISLFK